MDWGFVVLHFLRFLLRSLSIYLFYFILFTGCTTAMMITPNGIPDVSKLQTCTRITVALGKREMEGLQDGSETCYIIWFGLVSTEKRQKTELLRIQQYHYYVHL